MMGGRGRCWTVLSLAMGCLGACTGTPVTEPPAVAPPDLPMLNAAESHPAAFPAEGDVLAPLELSAGPGAVLGGALIWTINLDDDAPATAYRADDDGSFTVPIRANTGDTLRMHVMVDGVLSPPRDMLIADGLVLEAPQEHACVETLAQQLDFGAVVVDDTQLQTLEIDNTCDTQVSLETHLHAGSRDFSTGQLSDAIVASGESASMSLSFRPAAGPSYRLSVLFVDVSTGLESSRVPVTLWGEVR